jgi:glycosyltransferase involved in cell wall biosynthesis
MAGAEQAGMTVAIGTVAEPLVSVILPVFNGEEFLGDAIESALMQTYRNIEILIIDDGSTDRSRMIADTYAARDARVRVIAQPNSGVARARNRGISAARGEFIAPLDADDLWAPTKIERQVRCMLEEGDDVGLVYCWWVWIDAVGLILDRSPRWSARGNVFQLLLQINFTGNASVPLFRRRCLEHAAGYDETLAAAAAGGCEDWQLALSIAERSRVAVVPELLVGYRRRPDSMSTACDTMWRSQQRVMQSLKQRRPDIAPALFRNSGKQFALYLAGLSFWAGDLSGAFRWGLRAGFRLPWLIFPSVVKMMLRRFLRRAFAVQIMRPGVPLDNDTIAEALLPYDRIYNRRAAAGAAQQHALSDRLQIR